LIFAKIVENQTLNLWEFVYGLLLLQLRTTWMTNINLKAIVLKATNYFQIWVEKLVIRSNTNDLMVMTKTLTKGGHHGLSHRNVIKFLG
jgi:glutaminase